MKITKLSTVQHIFDQFNAQFPYLRLEFYSKSHIDNQGSRMEDQVAHNTLLTALNPGIVEASFVVDEEMAVSDFEKMMKDKFKLNVQVFRKSSDIWLQTSATDHWTLSKQNGKGHRSTEEIDIEPINITDFDVE